MTSKALASLKKVSKPGSACAQALATMFPASKPTPAVDAKFFDPINDCLAASAQRKKKSSRVKPFNVKVILIPKCSLLVLPKGKKRMKLSEEKRVQSVILKRNMTPSQVKAGILDAFKFHKLSSFEYLNADGGQLVTSTNQEPGGEIAERRGALYIREKDDKVSKDLQSEW